ncbi:MAG: arginase family protein [Gammaproteobacteria bacterium]|nr:arginase family protein [Gammaproteobacteria bacterium]
MLDLQEESDTSEPEQNEYTPATDPRADPMLSIWNDSSDESAGVFGLPFALDEASLAIVPAPWDAACSQGFGTALAPELILQTSRFLELHDIELGNIYERGIAMVPTRGELTQYAQQASILQSSDEYPARLDSLSRQFSAIVDAEVSRHIDENRRVGLLGGDHSVSLGAIAAHCRACPEMGILQIDAHADLRPSLDGLTRSHASVMYHVMEDISPVSLTQVGIRGLCSVERAYLEHNKRIHMISDYSMQQSLASGETWLAVCDRIIETLPEQVYLTLDIDGLDPAFCPHTGTPVPGGLTYHQVTILLHRLIDSGRLLLGFDLVEVGGHEQDALIAAHLLYRLCGLVAPVTAGG